MKIQLLALGLIVGLFVCSVDLDAADTRKEFDERLNQAIVKLNREAQVDVEGPALITDLLRLEYGTPEAEIKWAVSRSVNWGHIVILAYIQATMGRSFEALTAEEDARRDFWTYIERAEMSPDRMARSLESFLKRVEKERNSRIFERLRASRRIQALPDLGSGFGLFQEALDFRRIDSPRPTKIHTVSGGLAKGGQ